MNAVAKGSLVPACYFARSPPCDVDSKHETGTDLVNRLYFTSAPTANRDRASAEFHRNVHRIPPDKIDPRDRKPLTKLRKFPPTDRTPQCPQNSPVIRPSLATSMLSAAGTLGRPGMVMISPHTATTNSAPAESRTSRTLMT
jgi:hypothetical protein